MSQTLDEEIRTLRTHYWSSRDPDGCAFAPLADAYRRKGELDEASSLVRDGLGRLPEFATGHLVAARVSRDRGQLVDARSHLDRVLDLDPENVVALLERARMARSEGDLDRALEDLQKLLDLEPVHREARGILDELEESDLWGKGGEEAPSEGDAPAPAAESTSVAAPDFGEHLGSPWVVDPFDLAPTGESSEARELADEDLAGFDQPAGETAETGQPSSAREGSSTADAPGPEVEPEIDMEPEATVERELEPAPEAAVEGKVEADESLFTRTMGEIYARQGFVDRAVEIFTHLAARDPADPELETRLEELRSRHQASRSEPVGSGVVDSEPESRETDADPLSEDTAPERTIGDYFGDLLAWVPGAVPIESLAPDPVPIESLAPDPVEVESLAPEPPPVETSAEEPTEVAAADDADDGDDDDFDEFQSWLESLQS